jgi:crotonobetainyl-CoA:carnitine CoA-transferase CaiB-like acyl-CoA transferase
LAVNLKAPEAKEVILKLAQRADIVVENFRPGVMDKLGFGYADLKRINPAIIYCSATGLGPDGPYVSRPGQDLLVQGLSGAAMASGRKSDGPVAIGTALSDQLGAMHIVYSVLAALYYRTRTGKGQKIDVNLLQSVLAFEMQDFFTVQNMSRGFERPESGIAHPGNGAPFGIYRTADGHISIAMSPWSRIVEATGDAALAAYDDPQVLFDQRDEVYDALQRRLLEKTTDEWLKIMLGLDIWCAPVLEQKEVGKDAQVRHLQAFTEVEHPVAGKVKVTNIPFRMSGTPGAIRRPAPLVGQHGREILGEIGIDPGTIADYLERGIITIREADA